MSASVDVPSDFTLNSTTDLETEHTIYNSIRLTVKSGRNNVLIYAAIPSGITSQYAASIAVNNISLKLNHTTCPSGQQQNVVTTDVMMNNTGTLLFKQKKKNNLTAYWYYDVKIPALGYSYAPGHYQYTFQFTMTTQ